MEKGLQMQSCIKVEDVQGSEVRRIKYFIEERLRIGNPQLMLRENTIYEFEISKSRIGKYCN